MEKCILILFKRKGLSNIAIKLIALTTQHMVTMVTKTVVISQFKKQRAGTDKCLW